MKENKKNDLPKAKKVFRVYFVVTVLVFAGCLGYGFIMKPEFEKASQLYPYWEVTNVKIIIASAITAILWPALVVLIVLGGILELFGVTGGSYGPMPQ